MIKSLIIVFQTIWIFKLLNKSNDKKLEAKIKDLESQIKFYEVICKQYAGYFGARETLIILSKIQNNFNNGEYND